MNTSPRILILYNARSGHKQINFESFLRALDQRGARVETRMLGRHFNLNEVLADAAQFDRIVVAGGDGTISAVAGALQDSSVPIIAYPGGTANLYARNLNLPTNAEDLAETVLTGKAVRTDLGELEFLHYRRRDYFRRRILHREVLGETRKIPFGVMAGCGFAASLMSEALPWKARLGQMSYWISAFYNFFPHRAEFILKLDGREMRTEGIGILIVNFEKIQFDLKVVPEARAQDGKMEIAVIKARSLFGLLPIIWGAVLQRLGFMRPKAPEIWETFRASEIEVESHPAMRLQFDGELLEKSSAFKVSVRPGAALFVYGPQPQNFTSPLPARSV